MAGPALVAGGLVALSVPPLSWWPLAWLGLGLLAWLLTGLPARRRGLAGLVAGIAAFGPTLYFTAAFNLAGWGILVAGEALFWAVAAVLVPSGPVPRGSASGRIACTAGPVLGFPAVLVLAEAARGTWPFGGIPMGGIDLGQVSGPLAPALRLGGPLLVTGLAGLIGAAIASAALPAGQLLWTLWPDFGGQSRQRTSGSHPPRHLAPIGLGISLVVGLVVAGHLAPDGGPAVGRMQVAAVQGGGPRGVSQAQVDPAVLYRAQLVATLALHPPLSLVLWPEGVIQLGRPISGSQASAQVGGLARSLATTLVAGVTETVGATQFRNAAVAWGPKGAIVARYDKVHRVPFGEYVPFRGLLAHLVSLSAVPRDAIPGHGPGLLRTPAGRLGVMISFEVFYAERGRAATSAGGQVLLVPTDTASYSSTQVPTQELAAARIQAIAEGRDLVQAASTGYSALIDHRGRVLARSGLATRQVLQATIARRSGATLYQLGGDLPVLGAAGAALLAGWVTDRRGQAGPGSPSVRLDGRSAGRPDR